MGGPRSGGREPAGFLPKLRSSSWITTTTCRNKDLLFPELSRIAAAEQPSFPQQHRSLEPQKRFAGSQKDVADAKRPFEILCFAVRVIWVFGFVHNDRRDELAGEEA